MPLRLPIFEDGKVYVHFGHDGTACLNADDGKILWKQTQIRYIPVHGNGGSPIIVDDDLIFSCDGKEDPFIVALEKDSGKVVWKTFREVVVDRPFSFSTPPPDRSEWQAAVDQPRQWCGHCLRSERWQGNLAVWV